MSGSILVGGRVQYICILWLSEPHPRVEQKPCLSKVAVSEWKSTLDGQTSFCVTQLSQVTGGRQVKAIRPQEARIEEGIQTSFSRNLVSFSKGWLRISRALAFLRLVNNCIPVKAAFWAILGTNISVSGNTQVGAKKALNLDDGFGVCHPCVSAE